MAKIKKEFSFGEPLNKPDNEEPEQKTPVPDKEEEVLDRSNLGLQNFMNDMSKISQQIRDKDLVKPTFDYGAPEVTNFLIWLMLGELMILNDNLGEQ